jgi:predicted RNA-binding protein with EMAP domain
MAIEYEVVISKADQYYRELKRKKYSYADRELLHEGIQSDQIKALAKALIEEINEEIGWNK